MRPPGPRTTIGCRGIHILQTRGNIALSNRWQDWLNLILGAWLFISPWVLGFANTAAVNGATPPPHLRLGTPGSLACSCRCYRLPHWSGLSLGRNGSTSPPV